MVNQLPRWTILTTVSFPFEEIFYLLSQTISPMEKKTIKDHLDTLKTTVEGLNVQLHLGKADAEKAFEEQKANLRDWAVKMSSRIDEAKELNKEQAAKIKSALEDLRLQAALGKATSEDLLREQQKELKMRLEQLRSDIDLVFGTTKEHSDAFLEDLSLKLHDYQIKFDIFKLQLQLAKMEGEQEWEKRRKEAEVKLQEFQKDLEKRAEEASGKLEHFSNEMSQAWKHVSKAFD
ncbi:MAG: hypothetical protein H6603_09195 [Flavobacteriales bacterium]|nr:hypothetical protein [Flavobacteriales bacterium]